MLWFWIWKTNKRPFFDKYAAVPTDYTGSSTKTTLTELQSFRARYQTRRFIRLAKKKHRKATIRFHIVNFLNKFILAPIRYIFSKVASFVRKALGPIRCTKIKGSYHEFIDFLDRWFFFEYLILAISVVMCWYLFWALFNYWTENYFYFPNYDPDWNWRRVWRRYGDQFEHTRTVYFFVPGILKSLPFSFYIMYFFVKWAHRIDMTWWNPKQPDIFWHWLADFEMPHHKYQLHLTFAAAAKAALERQAIKEPNKIFQFSVIGDQKVIDGRKKYAESFKTLHDYLRFDKQYEQGLRSLWKQWSVPPQKPPMFRQELQSFLFFFIENSYPQFLPAKPLSDFNDKELLVYLNELKEREVFEDGYTFPMWVYCLPLYQYSRFLILWIEAEQEEGKRWETRSWVERMAPLTKLETLEWFRVNPEEEEWITDPDLLALTFNKRAEYVRRQFRIKLNLDFDAALAKEKLLRAGDVYDPIAAFEKMLGL